MYGKDNKKIIERKIYQRQQAMHMRKLIEAKPVLDINAPSSLKFPILKYKKR